MIRIWKGIEKEGIDSASEIMTLFVCSDVEVNFNLLKKLLQDNPDVRGIYFGAGRKEFKGMISEDWDKLMLYGERNNLSVAIEVNPILLESFTHLYNHKNVTFIVAYYNAPKYINNLYFKTDDSVVTKIYTVKKTVDITCVKDDKYPNDIVIYEED